MHFPCNGYQNETIKPTVTVETKTFGPQAMTFTPIIIARRKEYTEVSKRTLRARSKQSKDIIKMISG